MIILGIESSCDETGIGIVKNGRIVANVIATQEDIHAVYGGVVPELASRAHCSRIDGLLALALKQSGCSIGDVTQIGVTHTPGLKGALLVGVAFGSALGISLRVPVYRVNHLHAHLAANFLNRALDFPALGLVVSGGHTSLFVLHSPLEISCIGRTLDDACGETFDKVGRLLNLGFPGGPAVEREARKGNETMVKFPTALLGRESLDFSFSGLKTSVSYYAKRHGSGNIPDVCAGFQKAVADTLCEKVRRAVRRYPGRTFICGGGVVGNRYLVHRLRAVCRELDIRVFIPPEPLCRDNGAMIAILTSCLVKEKIPAPTPSIVTEPTSRC